MTLSPSALKVQATLMASGITLQVVELPESTRSAAEAAQAIGCRVEQIAKSLVFKGASSGKAILIIASGSNRVNEKAVGQLLGEDLQKADADFVRSQTGYAIGGIPPVGHSCVLQTLLDEDLMQLEEIWAAAGTPHAVFRLTPPDLIKITQGQVIKIT